MAVRIGTGLSTDARPARGGARGGRRGAPRRSAARRCDLAVVFASGAHLAAPEATLEAIHEVLAPDELIGCGAGGVIGHGREIEDGHRGLGLGGARSATASATTFHAAVEELEEGTGALTGHAGPRRRRRRDPARRPGRRSRPTRCCASCSEAAPMLPLLGGLASGARRPTTTTVLFIGDEVVDDGAVGVRLDGVEMLPLRLPGRGADRARADDHRRPRAT